MKILNRNTFVQLFCHFSGNDMLPYRFSEISDCFVAGIFGLPQSWQRRCRRKSPSCKKKRLGKGSDPANGQDTFDSMSFTVLVTNKIYLLLEFLNQ